MKTNKKLTLILTLIFTLTFSGCANKQISKEKVENKEFSQQTDILDGNALENPTKDSKEKTVDLYKPKDSNSDKNKETDNNSKKTDDKLVQANHNTEKPDPKVIEELLKKSKEVNNIKINTKPSQKPKVNPNNKPEKKPNNNPNTNPSKKPSTKPNTKPNKKPDVNPIPVVNSEKDLKNVIKNSLLSYPEKVKVKLGKYYSPDNWNTLNALIESIILNNLNFNYGFATWQWERTVDTLILTPNYELPRNTLKTQNEQVSKKVTTIINSIIKKNMTELQKEKAIHDYLINTTKYNYDNFKNGIYDPNDHSAYGPLILGTGVCDGYAKAMNLLLNKVGIESFVVVGIGNGTPHAWNIVKINGKYYNVDSTFDDPIGMGDILRYTYFNKSDSFFSSDHSRYDLGIPIPKCVDTKYDNYSDDDWRKMN